MSKKKKLGVKQQYDVLLKNHTQTYTKQMQEYEGLKGMKAELKGMKAEAFEGKEKGWRRMIEEMFVVLDGGGRKDRMIKN